MTCDASQLIDLGRYPIHRVGPERDAVLAQVRADLARDGCAVHGLAYSLMVSRNWSPPIGPLRTEAETDSVSSDTNANTS